jgi:hypothetical protein
MKDINDSQVRHEMLIDFLSQFKQYQIEGKPRLQKVKKQRSSDNVKDINLNDINAAVVVFIDTLNIGGGSIANIDLYELLQAYLTIPECRKEINDIVDKARRDKYQKNKK